MTEMNISRLNLHSPYYIVQDEEGDMFFRTDYGVEYGISFELNEENAGLSIPFICALVQ